MSSETFSIYVSPLSDYNAGAPHGSWIDVADCEDLEDLQNRVSNLLAESPAAEEFVIHDFKGFPEGIIRENSSLSEIWYAYEALELAERKGKLDAFCAYVSEFGDIDYQNFLDRYQGSFESKRDFVEWFLKESEFFYGVDPILERYFDYDAYTRDLFIDSYTFVDGFVFSYC